MNTIDLDPKILIESLHKHGYVLCENVLSPRQVRILKQELAPHFAKRAYSRAHFFGFRTKRIEALFSKSKTVQQLALMPTILTTAQQILKPMCEQLQINLTQGIAIGSSEKAQILHRDDAMFPLPLKQGEVMINALWAYTDFTEDNGATRVVPSSHRGSATHNADQAPQPMVMKAGSVLLYLGSLLHGGGANYTDQHRVGVVISYSVGWLRQSENQYLSYPPNIARTFPKALQTLIGYQVHRPNLGWVFGHQPMDLLSGCDSSHLGAQDFLTQQQLSLLKHSERPDTYH